MIVTAVISSFCTGIFAVVAFVLGFRSGMQARPQPAKPVKAECGCGHHFSFHSPYAGPEVAAGACGYGYCHCRQYSGPISLMEIDVPND